MHSGTSDQHRDIRASSEAEDGSTFYGWISQHSPFQYQDVDGLVDIANGVIADASANADRALEFGQAVAESLTGMTFSDIKLKRSTGVISIKAAREKIKVRGHEVEYSFELLFLRVHYVFTNPHDMQSNMRFEFSKQAPSLFENGLMRKNTKSVLGALLKENVAEEEYQRNPRELYVIDGGRLLKSVPWPDNGTYNEVYDGYISHINNNFRPHSHFILDGYLDPSSTKKCEQDRRIKGNIARTIVFRGETKLSEFHKTEFLNNTTNKSNFLKLLATKLCSVGHEVTECPGDADYDIAEAAISLAASTNDPVILDASDTDILVMLIADDRTKDNLTMQSTNRMKISNVKQKIKQNVKDHILVVHAISGCDTVSAPFGKGKTAAFKAVNNDKDLSFLNVFKCPISSHKEIAEAGEKLMLMIYNSPLTITSLDDLRYDNYKKQLLTKNLESQSGFDLRALPPTSDVCKYHSYRAYLQVQQWLGNKDISPADWGWVRCTPMGYLIPVIKDNAAAPERVLKSISCGCKQGCNRNCKCRKAGLLCTPLCSACNGIDCSNGPNSVPDV